MLPIFNIPYSPQFNGIESYFSLLKAEYKKLLLKNILKDNSYTVPTLIKQALRAVTNQKAMNCARNGREAIEKQALI
jgi:hypothetical protein